MHFHAFPKDCLFSFCFFFVIVSAVWGGWVNDGGCCVGGVLSGVGWGGVVGVTTAGCCVGGESLCAQRVCSEAGAW